MKLHVISFDQPAGSFLLTAMAVPDILRISHADPRKFDQLSMETVGGIQREPSSKRIREIADYSNTVDASFPTAILLALKADSYTLKESTLQIADDAVADIVDGQHRILGLKESKRLNEFTVPVVFILDATEEQKALIFATINGKQTKVPASLVYDLFGVTKARSPQKTAHEIARAINGTTDSPWYQRLKMLGRKSPESIESLSQGTFVKFLLPHISSKPEEDMDFLRRGKYPPPRSNCIFNEYFRKEDDATILKILTNIFQATKETWPQEWDDPKSSILTKTTGFSAIMNALPAIVEKGRVKSDLSMSFASPIFLNVRQKLEGEGKSLTSGDFPPSALSERKLSQYIIEAANSIH